MERPDRRRPNLQLRLESRGSEDALRGQGAAKGENIGVNKLAKKRQVTDKATMWQIAQSIPTDIYV